MLNRFRLSLDRDSLNESRGESEIERLKDELKKKQAALEGSESVVAALRSQLNDLRQDNEELEDGHELLKQKVSRLEKEVSEKSEELEAISHTLKELETANESLGKRLEGRTVQLQKLVDELAKSKKELDESQMMAQQLREKNELLKVEMESMQMRKRTLRTQDRDSEQELIQELEELRQKVKSLEKQLASNTRSTRRYQPVDDEVVAKLKEELEVTETSWKLEQQHKERYARENLQLDRKVSELTKLNAQLESEYRELELKLKQQQRLLATVHQQQQQQQQTPPPPLPPKTCTKIARRQLNQQHLYQTTLKQTDENRPQVGIPFSMTDEVGEFMEQIPISGSEPNDKLNDVAMIEPPLRFAQGDHQDKLAAMAHETNMIARRFAASAAHVPAPASAANYCTNHRIQKSKLLQQNDPIAEQRMRLERANELARRNMQTKPLHQTSYPLELDTFDPVSLVSGAGESANVKRRGIGLGNGPSSISSTNSLPRSRPALIDSSNQRKPFKKAEAFIV